MNQLETEIVSRDDADANSALAAIEKAQIDSQVATAKRWPRDPVKVRLNMIKYACMDESSAAKCYYVLPRGNKTIEGPSVRLAEIALSCFQNLRSATRCISVVTTGDNPHVVVQSVAHDLENNVATSIEKRRRIVGKKQWLNGECVGHKPPDEDDVNLAVNACSAIAFRDAVFKVVPQTITSQVLAEARKMAIGDVKSIAAKRAKVLERLLKIGARMDRILDSVGVRSENDIDAAKLEILIGLGTALKDGDVTLEDAFPARQQASESAEQPAAPRRGRPPGSKNKVEESAGESVPITVHTPPQQELAAYLGGFEITIADFSAWAQTAGHIERPVTEWEAIPTDVAARLLMAKKPMANAIVAMKGGAQ